MTQLIPGEYNAVLNNIQIHYTLRGSGLVMIVHSGGPGMYARDWESFG